VSLIQLKGTSNFSRVRKERRVFEGQSRTFSAGVGPGELSEAVVAVTTVEKE